MLQSQVTRGRLVSGTDIARIIVGWGAVLAMLILGPMLTGPVPGMLLLVTLTVIIVVISISAFGVVKQAEALAQRLGDPYGSLVLTLSIVLIEVILIAAVMLGPGEHTTIARDSIMAVSMIIMNLVIGLSLLVGGIRHGAMRHNRTGTSAYLSMLIVLSTLAFALPGLIGTNGSYTPAQEVPIILLTLVLYAFFLFQQVGEQADDFREADERLTPVVGETSGSESRQITHVLRDHRSEIFTRLVLLLVTVLPIVLLSHDMATLLDDGLGRLGAPIALTGVLIATIVFLPETLTSIRAAYSGEVQRVSNLCHGALTSTLGLTIPAVLIIGISTNQEVVLAESPANLLMLAVTMLLSVTTFTARKVTAVHGATHLVVFAAYILILFS